MSLSKWSRLGQARAAQERLATHARRMAPGSLGGRTEVASPVARGLPVGVVPTDSVAPPEPGGGTGAASSVHATSPSLDETFWSEDDIFFRPTWATLAVRGSGFSLSTNPAFIEVATPGHYAISYTAGVGADPGGSLRLNVTVDGADLILGTVVTTSGDPTGCMVLWVEGDVGLIVNASFPLGAPGEWYVIRPEMWIVGPL